MAELHDNKRSPDQSDAELFRKDHSSPRSAVVRLMELIQGKKTTVTIYPTEGGTKTFNVKKETETAERKKTGMLTLLNALREPQRRGHTAT